MTAVTVAPEYRRQRLAAQLMASLEEITDEVSVGVVVFVCCVCCVLWGVLAPRRRAPKHTNIKYNPTQPETQQPQHQKTK